MATTSSLEEALEIMTHPEEGSSKEMGPEMMATSTVQLEEVTKEEEVFHNTNPTTTLETPEMEPTIVKSSAAMGAEVTKTAAASTEMVRAILVDRIQMIEDRIQIIEDRIMMLEDRIQIMTIRLEECLTWSSSTC